MRAEEVDVVVVGGGPAGLAAAAATGGAGLRTLLVEERDTLGGQVYRPFPAAFTVDARAAGRAYRRGRDLERRARAAGVQVRTGTTVWDIGPGEVLLAGPDGPARVAARAVVVAAGAYDRPVVFPGWTLPGVMTAGGVHALVRTQGVRPGRRLLLAGTGPLVIAFAAQMVHDGAELVEVADPAPALRLRDVLRLVAAGPTTWPTLLDGAGYLATLHRHGVRIRPETVVTAVHGESEVTSATVSRVDGDWCPVPGTGRTVDVDTVCLGYGFLPSVELTLLAGCAHRDDESLGGQVPVRDAWMRTTVRGVYAAGDGAGAEGSAVAVAEGEIAGLAVAADLGAIEPRAAVRRASSARRRLRQMRRLRAVLAARQPVGPGLDALADESTVVCRCEDVTAGRVRAALAEGCGDLDAVKGLTRAGMGPCQGRNCERALRVVQASGSGGRAPAGPGFRRRPPVRPVALSALLDSGEAAGARPVAETEGERR